MNTRSNENRSQEDQNDEFAGRLGHVADLLELQDANPFRVRSYRRAAEQVRQLEQPVGRVFEEKGLAGLKSVEGIGEKLAGSLRELIETGRLGLEERLESQLSPEKLLARVPGVGEQLAERIHDELGISTLEDLEQAAHNGRLARIEGFGPKRVQGIQDALAGMLGRSSRRRAKERVRGKTGPDEPSVGLLLELDRKYRQRAESGKLPKIAPKRFNPTGEKWLPIFKTERDGWQFTLLYSNTKRAHELDKTRDWVVVYYEQDHDQDQCTAVTARSGRLRGRRVIRGREQECKQYYEDSDDNS